jgi:hypothetical protein
MLEHTCGHCGLKFPVNSKVLLRSGWGRSLEAGLLPSKRQLEDYQRVACPRCATIERDDRIKSYGIFKPATVVVLVLGLVFVLLAMDLLDWL